MAVKTKRTRRTSKASTGTAIATAAASHGVPLWVLTAVKLLETGSDRGTGAVSSAGANGPFQLEPATARSLGVRDPNNFNEAANGAAKLLASYHKKYGSWSAALEAYNGGPGAVGKGYAYNESTAIGKLNEFGFHELVEEAHGKQLPPTAQGHTVFAATFGLPEGPAAEGILKGLGGLLGHGSGSPEGKLGEEAAPTVGPIVESVVPAPIVQAGAATVAFLSMLTDIKFWIRAGEALAALILIYMGLHSLTGQGPGVSDVAANAVKAPIP